MSPDWIDELAEKLAPMVPIPSPDSGVVEDLARLAQTWVLGLAKADKLAISVGKPLEPVRSEHIRDALRRRFDPEFDTRARRLLAVAKDAGALTAWEDRVESLLEFTREIHSAFDRQYDPVDFRDPKRSAQAFNRPMALRRKFDDELASFRRLGSTLPVTSGPLKELAPTERRVWDLLEQGPLPGKEIARRLGPNYSPDAVYKAIHRIRATGRKIALDRAQGYYRPETPTPRGPIRK